MMDLANADFDYSEATKQSAAPQPTALIETFRAMGYQLETAVADILDNSIAAKARKIELQFTWNATNPTVYMLDNGHGMTNQGIIEAMRPGSKSPLEVRSATDLGRFGLGLKTASFSQCRKLTVVSKTVGQPVHYWTWDLDYIQRHNCWDIINSKPNTHMLQLLDPLESGTLVIWEKMDKFVKTESLDTTQNHKKFLEAAEQVQKHLAMVFHRFIENRKIAIYFNSRIVEAWDPFFKGVQGCQPFAEEPLKGGQIKIKGYVLPHKSKLSEDAYKHGEGLKGWNAQQGFYVYRNERLLLAGDWLGLFKKEEHYKLARIMIDIPNTLDHEWQIDIKKSTAALPYGLRTILRTYATKVRGQAVDVYKHRGKTLQRKFAQEEFYHVWNEKVRRGKRYYEINREHPLIQKCLETQDPLFKQQLQQLLKCVEETVPIPLIVLRESEQSDMHIQPFEEIDHTLLRASMQQMYAYWLQSGKNEETAKRLLLNTEPFHLYPQYIELL